MNGEPQYPPQEEIRPNIHPLLKNRPIQVVGGGAARNILEFRVASFVGARDAYQIFPDVKPIPIAHGGPRWGYVYVGYIMKQVAPNVYEVPTARTRQDVAIKVLDKSIFQREISAVTSRDPDPLRVEKTYLGTENPYREIYRMQTIGDNHHVLGCVEALEDEDQLCIITPKCNGGDLLKFTQKYHGGNLPEVVARGIFRQMLEDLKYLHETCGICHRDIDPGNFLVHGEEVGPHSFTIHRVILNDLAMSFPIPSTGMVKHLGRFGKQCYLAPEIQFRKPFCARQADLWACTVALANLMTGLFLWHSAQPDDMAFRYCVQAHGISEQPVNERTEEVLSDLGRHTLGDTETLAKNTAVLLHISHLAQRIITLSPELRALFERTFSLFPSQRWTIDDILECQWMRMRP